MNTTTLRDFLSSLEDSEELLVIETYDNIIIGGRDTFLGIDTNDKNHSLLDCYISDVCLDKGGKLWIKLEA